MLAGKGERQGEKDAGRLSRRKILRLAAYAAPAMSLLDVAGVARAAGQSAPVVGCCRKERVTLGTPGAWYIYDCVNGQPDYSLPVCHPGTYKCYYFTQNPPPGAPTPCAYTFVACGQWLCGPVHEGCYVAKQCSGLPTGCWRLVPCP